MVGPTSINYYFKQAQTRTTMIVQAGEVDTSLLLNMY